MHSILVYSQSRAIRSSLKELLEHEKYCVFTANDRAEADEVAKVTSLSLIIYHISKMDVDGSLPKEIKEYDKETYPVIIITEQDNNNAKIELDKIATLNIISRPINIPTLLTFVRKSIEEREKSDETTNEASCWEESPLSLIVGNSDKIEEVKRMIDIVALTDARVLITGDNGTGKEMVAKCIHKLSKRSKNVMIEVNCAAIPSELIESELFGHEKGAFTSAIKQRKGKFEQANGGTLFLDEIGDMCLSAQAKMLRTLQERKITRVGGDGEIAVDARIIAATNKNLKEEILKGNFREDLYHRLGVIEIKVPTLNERINDIPHLVDSFMMEICSSYDTPIKKIDPAAIEMLQNKQWNGNIRELHNAIEKLIIFSTDTITCDLVRKFVL